IAERDLVEVQLENFVLAQRIFDAPREKQFRQLARVTFLGTQEEVARHLLRDRTRALRFFAAMRDDVPRRAYQSLPVETRMLVKARVLGGEKGVLELRGNLIDLDRNAPRLTERRHKLGVGGVD